MTEMIELKNDITELENFRKSATREKVQKFLDAQISQWKSELQTVKASFEADSNIFKEATPKQIVRPYKKLTTYAFDESDKFVKLYYTIPDIAKISVDRVISKFTESSFYARCVDVNGIDYETSAVGLLHVIDASKSLVKIKSDSLLVMLKKKTEGQNWGSLVKLQKTLDEPKVPKFDEDADPNDSLMNMMKQMYDSGDDEMKRTIRKAWHESQSKKGDLNMPSEF